MFEDFRCGVIYFANIVSRETRWAPPHRWMQGWVSRRGPFIAEELDISQHPYIHVSDGRAFDHRTSPSASYARRMVEGGAPYMHEDGAPQYAPDAFDTDASYPLNTTLGFVKVSLD